MSKKIINAQRKSEPKATPIEEETQEIVTKEIAVPSNSMREKWRETLERVSNIVNISDNFSNRLNLEILEIVENFERQ